MQQLDDNVIDLTDHSPHYYDIKNYRGYVFSLKDIALELYRVTKSGEVVADATIIEIETR